MGPIIVPIAAVMVDPDQVRERDVKRYVEAPSTQSWYFEPIPCIKIGTDSYEANGVWAHSMVAACRRIGYEDLQICYVEEQS